MFVDGNHENFDKLYQYPEKDWHGGRVHEIRPNVLHLMRGHVFDIQGHSFFCMGGAMSHDIDNGVVIEGNRHQHTATVLKRVRNPFGDSYEDAFIESEITNYIHLVYSLGILDYLGGFRSCLRVKKSNELKSLYPRSTIQLIL